MAPKTQTRRIGRAGISKATRLFLGENTILHGLSNDISPGSFSMFLSLEGGAEYFKARGVPALGRLSVLAVKKVLVGEKSMLGIDDAAFGGPIDFTILRVEPSWVRGFDLFVAGRFENTDAFFEKKIAALCPALHQQRQPGHQRYVSEKLRVFRKRMVDDGAAWLELSYSNSLKQVHAFRDVLALLAGQYGFGDEDVYAIKIMADEVLMNAFLYGSIEPKRDHTEICLSINERGMLVEVSDHAGRVFDEYPYHFRKDLPPEKLGGLTLVEAYSDDWQVDFDPGRKTTVAFFKTVAHMS